mgnify:CR=1 FL=1
MAFKIEDNSWPDFHNLRFSRHFVQSRNKHYSLTTLMSYSFYAETIPVLQKALAWPTDKLVRTIEFSTLLKNERLEDLFWLDNRKTFCDFFSLDYSSSDYEISVVKDFMIFSIAYNHYTDIEELYEYETDLFKYFDLDIARNSICNMEDDFEYYRLLLDIKLPSELTKDLMFDFLEICDSKLNINNSSLVLSFCKELNDVYKDEKEINWCPKCKTGLSNEDAQGGVCERCGDTVVQKEKSQWMLRMGDYAEDLLKGLDDTNFAEKVKLGQINWIGKSTGVEVDVEIVGGGKFSIFTTCIETIYGITFFVIAPDGKIIKELMPRVENKEEVEAYIAETAKKSNMDRTELNKGKTGVEVKGIKAKHPITGEEVPIFLGDFVLGDYGTGAVMAVPSHDQRDFEYAVAHNIPMVQVIDGADVSEKAHEKQDYLGKGCKLMNSAEFTGMTVEEAKDAITKKLVAEGIAREVNNYKMRDWIFSRQRFWGEPIPMIYCEKCGWQPMDEKDLPLLLPDVAEYEPTDNGESPLAKINDWVNTTCPCCGGAAKRETDTMPNWAGSSWYFLRFMDANNNDEFASMDAMKYWSKVDWYNGGMEHTARHLLYARFWVQFLYNIGLVPNKEMIWTRVSHGMVLGSNNEKMSKSKGNVINPDDIVNEFGADTLRVYEMFMGDYEQDAPWSTDSLRGCKRFLDKIIRMKEKVVDGEEYSKELETIIHKSIILPR